MLFRYLDTFNPISLWSKSVIILLHFYPMSVISYCIVFLSDLRGYIYLKLEDLSTTNKAHLTPFMTELQS